MAAELYGSEDLRGLTAAATLTTRRAVKLDATGLAAVPAANQRRIAGVVVDPGLGANRTCTVITRGRVKVEAGAAIALADGGQPLTTDNTGRFVVATTGQFVHAIAYQAAGAAGEIIEVELGNRAVAA